MLMDVRSDIDESFWWEVAEACEYATFFHSPLWHRLATATYDECVDRSVGAVTDDGVRLVLPLLQTGTAARGVMKKLNSTFAGCYGGVIADGPVAKADLVKLYDHVQSWNVASMQVNGNPLWDVTDRPVVLPEEAATDEFTHIIGLEGSTFDDVLSNFSRGHRSSMNKGERMGVNIRKATSLADYQDYYGAYEDCLRRWDNPSSEYPWRLFENGFDLAKRHPEKISLWLAVVEDIVVGGAWFFCWNHHLVYWHGATYEEYFDYRTNNVLHPTIIKDALEQGFRYFDFNPSGGHEGVAKFKSRFGAEKWPLKRWTMKDRKLDFIRRAKKKITGSS